MRPARRLQPRVPRGGQATEPSLRDLVERGADDAWGRADGMVALSSWDDLSAAVSAASADLRQAWLRLTSVGSRASLLLVRAVVIEATPRIRDEERLLREGFRPGDQTDTWLRRADPADLRVVVHALRGPLEVPHPRDLRFTLLTCDASRVRLMFGPLREQRRRPPAPATQLHPAGKRRAGPPCRRCGQAMVDPVSIERGYGPDCWDALTAT